MKSNKFAMKTMYCFLVVVWVWIVGHATFMVATQPERPGGALGMMIVLACGFCCTLPALNFASRIVCWIESGAVRQK